MLGAAQRLFAKYQADVWEYSNPADFDGLAAAMHSEFEMAAIDTDKLPSLEAGELCE